MMNSDKEDGSYYDKERLKKAFPKKLESDINAVLKIIPLQQQEIKLDNGKIRKIELMSASFFEVKIDGEELEIPYRVYFEEPNTQLESTLTDNQRVILNCIYTRHHDGYLRQRRLMQLAGRNEYWVTPFKFQLLGEYVKIILEVLDYQMDDNSLENYKRFAIENPKFYQITENRMISYWNEYYRGSSEKKGSYLGFLIFNQIKGRH